MQKYDVFISYRRDGGDVTAKHLRDALTERGYRVFLDVESLRNGPFNEALYEVIENTKDFLLILPPNGLDRCVNENDWVRLEIEHAKTFNLVFSSSAKQKYRTCYAQRLLFSPRATGKHRFCTLSKRSAEPRNQLF